MPEDGSGERGEMVRLSGASAEPNDNRFKPDPSTPYAHPYYWAPFILMGNWL